MLRYGSCMTFFLSRSPKRIGTQVLFDFIDCEDTRGHRKFPHRVLTIAVHTRMPKFKIDGRPCILQHKTRPIAAWSKTVETSSSIGSANRVSNPVGTNSVPTFIGKPNGTPNGGVDLRRNRNGDSISVRAACDGRRCGCDGRG